MSTYKERATELETHIAVYDYYQHIWKAVKGERDIADSSDSTICQLMNDFWAALPDHPAIHRVPFYALCDLCTGEDIDNEFPADPTWNEDSSAYPD